MRRVPKKRRQAKIPTPAWERPRGALGSRILGRGGQFYGAVVVGLLIAVALAVIGYAFLNDYVEKQRRPGSTAIQVEDTRFRLDYFSDRLKMYVAQLGGPNTEAARQPSVVEDVANSMIREEIVRRFAAEFEVSAKEDEIQEAIAKRLGISVDDQTFDVVFQQELTRSGIKEPDYRKMVEAEILVGKLRQMFEDKVPESVESAHYRQILVSTEEAAQEIRDQIEGGGDFAALAKESLDTSTNNKGGDVGWVPRGVLDVVTEELVFALEPGGLTTVPSAQGVYVVEMLEKAKDRPVDADKKAPLGDRAFRDWVDEKTASVTIANKMSLSDGDIKKIEWAVNRAYQS